MNGTVGIVKKEKYNKQKYNTNWAKKNPEKYKLYREKWEKHNIKRRNGLNNLRVFGVTPEQYQDMIISQSGVCAICGEKPENSNKRVLRLGIDHNHLTGKIRGLLCFHCNTGLGLFKDNKDILARAISYLMERD